MIGTIGPIMIVTKVAMNWQNKLASATCPRVSTAASRFEFLQDITTFSDFKAGSEVVSCKLLSHNVDTIQCLVNVLVLFYFIWQVVMSNHSAFASRRRELIPQQFKVCFHINHPRGKPFFLAL